MQDNAPRQSVLICHQNQSTDLAYQLAADLKDLGFDIWVERLDLIKSGDIAAGFDQCGVILPIMPDDETVVERSWAKLLRRANKHSIALIPLIQSPRQPESDKYPGQTVSFIHWRNELAYQKSLDELIQVLDQLIPEEDKLICEPEAQHISHIVADIKRYRVFLESISPRSDTLPLDKRAIYAQSMWGLTGEFEVADTSSNTEPESNTTYQFHEVMEQFPRFMLVGDSGAGKTITLYRTLLDATRLYQTDRNQHPLPLLVHLGRWEDDIPIETLIRDSWSLADDPLELAAQGKVLLLLDGLDEIGHPIDNKLSSLRLWLHGEQSPQQVVITCQTNHYDLLQEADLPIIRLRSINAPRIRQYVYNHLSKEAAERLLQQIVAQEANGTQFSVLHEMARNALLLSIMVSFIQHHPAESMPDHEARLLQWLARFLWDQLATEPPVSYDDALPYLSRLAFDSIEDELSSSFDYEYARVHIQNDAVLQHAIDVSLLLMRNGRIRFSHQKLRDVLATHHILLDGVYKRLMQPQFDKNGKRKHWKWDSVTILCSGLTDQPSALVKEVVQVDPILAIECLARGINVSDRALLDVMNHLVEYTLDMGGQPLDQMRDAVSAVLNDNGISALLESLHRTRQSATEFKIQNADEELTMLLKKLGTDTGRILVEILRGERWQRRSSAAWVLGELREPAAVPSLVEALRDENEAVRREASLALERIGAPAAPRLLVALNDTDLDLQASLIKLLGKLKEQTAVPALIAQLSNAAWPTMEETRICDLAASALEAIGTDDAIQAVDIWRQGGKPLAHASEWGEKVRDQSRYSVRHNIATETLFENLESDTWSVRRDAVKKLGEGGNSIALPYVIRATTDEDSQVRLAAVEALKGFHGPDVIQALVECLRDEEALICDAATEALTLQGQMALQNLLQAMSDEVPNVRGAAAEILGRIGDEQAIPYLVDALSDITTPRLETRRICDIAARALEHIGTEKALFALNQWRKDQGIAYGLPNLTSDMPLLHLDHIEPDDPDRIAVITFLDTLHESDWHTRQVAAQHLRKFAESVRDTENASHAVESLSTALEDDESLVRWSAAEALALIGDRYAVPALLSALSDRNWTVRVAAIRAIGEIEAHEAIQKLINSLNDPYIIVREAAAETLGKIADVTAADALVQALNDEDSCVRFAVVQALGELGDSLVVPELVSLLNDEDISIRWAAIEALGKIGDTASVSALIQCLDDTASPSWEERRLCDAAAEALQTIGSQPAREAVESWRMKQPE